MLKKVFLVVLFAFVVIQFIHPKKNKATGSQVNYIGNVYAVPEDVKTILSKACNDCNNNNTNYPLNTNIQPVNWCMNKHFKYGKKHINIYEYTNRNHIHGDIMKLNLQKLKKISC